MLKIKLLSVRKIREHVAERSGGNRERSNIMLRETGGAECSNRGERVFKYTRPPLRPRDGVFAVQPYLLMYVCMYVCMYACIKYV